MNRPKSSQLDCGAVQLLQEKAMQLCLEPRTVSEGAASWLESPRKWKLTRKRKRKTKTKTLTAFPHRHRRERVLCVACACCLLYLL